MMSYQRQFEIFFPFWMLTSFLPISYRIYYKNHYRKGEGMSETVEIKGIKYKATHTDNQITLQRYNEKFEMWVNLHFPKGNQEEGKKIEADIIELLSNLYIERNSK
jgi:hypothetical protein